MQKIVPWLLLALMLMAVALVSDMAGVALRQLAQDPELSPGNPYRPALLRGGIPPH